MSLFQRFDASLYEFFEDLACIDVDDKPDHPDHKPRYGFMDRKGNLRIPAIYDAAGDFSGGLAAVMVDGEWGYIDTKGRTIIAFIYHEAHGFADGVALVKLNGKYRYIDTKGNEAAMSGSREEVYFREEME